MVATLVLDRDRWLGYRWYRHGLGGAGLDAERLDDLLALGVQDSPPYGAAFALGQRTGGVAVPRVGVDGPLRRLWSIRGVPHVHGPEQAAAVRAALTPRPTDTGGPEAVAALRAVADALSRVVTAPTAKSVAATRITARVPTELVSWCPHCRADHVPEGLFRAAARTAGLLLGVDAGGETVLYPTPEGRVAGRGAGDPRRRLLDSYLRVHGPATGPLFADWLGLDPTDLADVWAETDSEPVRIGSRRLYLPAALWDTVRTAPPATGTALVPPHDPYLRHTDRALLVPNTTYRREVWRTVSMPGAVLDAGEVIGTWRYRRAENIVTVTAFAPLHPAVRRRIEERAHSVAVAAGRQSPGIDWQ